MTLKQGQGHQTIEESIAIQVFNFFLLLCLRDAESPRKSQHYNFFLKAGNLSLEVEYMKVKNCEGKKL